MPDSLGGVEKSWRELLSASLGVIEDAGRGDEGEESLESLLEGDLFSPLNLAYMDSADLARSDVAEKGLRLLLLLLFVFSPVLAS